MRVDKSDHRNPPGATRFKKDFHMVCYVRHPVRFSTGTERFTRFIGSSDSVGGANPVFSGTLGNEAASLEYGSGRSSVSLWQNPEQSNLMVCPTLVIFDSILPSWQDTSPAGGQSSTRAQIQLLMSAFFSFWGTAHKWLCAQSTRKVSPHSEKQEGIAPCCAEHWVN